MSKAAYPDNTYLFEPHALLRNNYLLDTQNSSVCQKLYFVLKLSDQKEAMT